MVGDLGGARRSGGSGVATSYPSSKERRWHKKLGRKTKINTRRKQKNWKENNLEGMG